MTPALHFPVAPMKATLGSLPLDEGWAFEVKWDGYRTVAHVGTGGVRLQSTGGHDTTDRWPELAALGAAVDAESAIIVGMRQDQIIPPAEVEALHRHWVGSRLRWVEGSHMSAIVGRVRAMREAIYDAFSIRIYKASQTGEPPP